MTEITTTRPAEELDRFFREVVLCLGGIFAVREAEDDLVWQVTKSLERLYESARARLRDEPDGGADLPHRRPQPHPAIAELLLRIGR
jgi:hypothetical protein